MKTPAAFLLEAIREHERMHVEQICSRQQRTEMNLSPIGELVTLQGGSESMGRTVVRTLQEFNKLRGKMLHVRMEQEFQMIKELVPYAVEATVVGLKNYADSEIPSMQVN